jgi:hypothetical protein
VAACARRSEHLLALLDRLRVATNRILDLRLLRKAGSHGSEQDEGQNRRSGHVDHSFLPVVDLCAFESREDITGILFTEGIPDST